VQKPQKKISHLNKKYVTFFDNVPVALWIEDFSQVKKYITTVAKENNTTVNNYLANNPSIFPKLASLVKIKDVNKKAVQLYEATNKKELLENLNKVFNKKSLEGFSKLVKAVLFNEKIGEIETVNKTLNGNEFDIALKFNILEGSEETLKNIIISIEDITEKVKTRTILFSSEQRYRQAHDIAKIGSWNYDITTKKTYWSEEVYKLLEIEKPKEQIDINFYLSFVHKDDRKLVENFSVNFLLKNQKQNLQYRVLTNRGELKYIHEKRSVIVKDEKIIGLIGICQDVTDTILNENKITATNNLFSNTLSSINDGFVILDYNSRYLYVNDEAANLLNISNPKDLIGKHLWTEFPEKKGDVFFDNYHKALKTGKPIRFENYFKPWNRWFDNRIIPSSEGMLIFFHETTDKKVYENKIKEAYNIINKSSSVAILCKNERDFPFEFVSENAFNLFGYSTKELLSNQLKIAELLHPEDLDIIRNQIFNLLKNSKTDSLKPKPFRIVTKNGKIKWVRTTIDTVKNAKNKITHIQGITEDFTEQKNIEDQLFKQTQLLKYQFNNTPLASIIWDLDYKILEWNKSAERIFGYTAAEVKGKICKDLLTPPHLLAEMKQLRENAFFKQPNFKNTNENITKSGKIITCDWYSVAIKDANNNIIGSASLVDDITKSVRSKELLQKSEQKYRDIFEKTVDAVLLIKDGVFVDCNASTLKMFGYKNKSALIQLHPSKISPVKQNDGINSHKKAEEMIAIALEKGSNRFRWLHKRKNGQVFPAEVSLTRIDDIDNTSRIHSVVEDISERVKQEQLENVLYNISKAALTINDFKEFGYFIKDELEHIIDTSNFYIAIYDEETDLVSTPVFVDEKEAVEEFYAKGSLTGHVIKTKSPLLVTNLQHQNLIEKRIVDLVGSPSECWLGVPLLINKKAIGAIVIQSYENETAYNQNDVQLLEFVANQIGTTIQRKKAENELTIALKKAQESDKLKSSFLANMSHEIRTPMNGIIGFSELFLEPNLTAKERKNYAQVVINSSKQLLSIVNDILDISKIEAGVVELDYESVNLNKLLDTIYGFYKPKAIENNLQLSCIKNLNDADSFIEIDQTKLRQIITNLLSNAFKFTDAGSVQFGYELTKDKLQFFVKDTGVGIEKKLRNKIFDRFIQANKDLNKKLQGTGLGLSISKKFVELFGGKIWVDPTTNLGTTIFFTIPYKKVTSKKVKTVDPTNIKPKNQVKDLNLNILVAEDEAYNMMYINELFSKTNFNIIEAENGKEAVALFSKNSNIDLILMDIKMPVMNGHEAMKTIKKINPKIPIIALSAFAMESDKKDAIKEGFDAYLTKPIDRKLLFKIIQQYSK
jgi:PAS domain S-box-containing protein